MIDQKRRVRTALRGLNVLAVLALLVTGLVSEATPMSAQANGGMVIGVSLQCVDGTGCGPEYSVPVTVTTADGQFLGTCTVHGNLNDSSHLPACSVSFPFRPTGTLTVTQDNSTLPAGYAPTENPMYVDSSGLGRASHDVGFANVYQGSTSGTGQTSDVAIATLENGSSAYDACYVLVGYSNEGCDENRDGQVTFQDIPLGSYTVRQTTELGSGRAVSDFTIQVRGNVDQSGWEVFPSTITSNSGGFQVSAPGPVDISLITRDPDNGTLLRDTCYVLVGYGNEGCDENGDGQVTFADIPLGTYSVRQTRVPAGYPQINDFEITVFRTDYPTGYIVRQAREQNAPNTRNVSIMLVDSATNTKIPTEACVEIMNASNVGCDEDLRDGQIDFLDVPAGRHDVVVTGLPAGYVIVNPDDLYVDIDAENDPANLFLHIHVKSQP